MMRKFTHYFLVCTIWCGVVSCDPDETAPTPPKPSFTVDETAGLVGDTEFTFVVQPVDAETVTLFPYGVTDPGIIISFDGGAATTVTFTYAKPGVFQAVVRANNHSINGKAVENVESDPRTITIASDDKSITAFTLPGSTETEIDDGAGTIAVTVPFGTDLTALKATFTASSFSTVTVGGTAQESGKTANNFTAPVVYTVTANDGTSRTYTVSVDVTPAETWVALKSITAKAVSKSADDKELSVFIDTVDHVVVVYDVYGTAETQFDSVRIGYETMSAFAIVKYGADTLDQDSLLNLTTIPNKQIEVVPEDGASATYDILYADAPKVDSVTFGALNPIVIGKPDNFTIDINVLKGTDIESIATTLAVTAPAGVTIISTQLDGAVYVPGVPVDYSEPVSLELTVTDTNLPGVTYTVTYTINVTVVQ